MQRSEIDIVHFQNEFIKRISKLSNMVFKICAGKSIFCVWEKRLVHMCQSQISYKFIDQIWRISFNYCLFI